MVLLKKVFLVVSSSITHHLLFLFFALGVYLLQNPVGTYHLCDDQIVNINWYMVSSGLTPSSPNNYMAMESLVAYFPIQLAFALNWASSYEIAFALLNLLYFLVAMMGIYHLIRITAKDNIIAFVGSVAFVCSTITFRTGDAFSFVPVSSALARNGFFLIYILLLWYLLAAPHTGLKLCIAAVGLASLVYIYPLYAPVLGIVTLLALLAVFYRNFEKRRLLLWLLAAGMLALGTILPYLLSLRGQLSSAHQSELLSELFQLHWGEHFSTPFSGLAHFILDILKSREKSILLWFALFTGVMVPAPRLHTRFFIWCAVGLVGVNFIVIRLGFSLFQTVPRPTDEMNRNYLYIIPFIFFAILSLLADFREKQTTHKFDGWRYYAANFIFLGAVFILPLWNTWKHIYLNEPVITLGTWMGQESPEINLQAINSGVDSLVEYIREHTSSDAVFAAPGWVWYRTQRQVLFDTQEHPVEAFVALHNEDVILSWGNTVEDFYRRVGMDPYDESGWPIHSRLIIENVDALPVDYLILEKFAGSLVDGFAFRQIDLPADFNVVFENQFFILIQIEKDTRVN